MGLTGNGKTFTGTVNGDAGQFDYGDGADGAQSWSGTVTLSRNWYCTDLTLANSTTINMAGWVIRVKGTLTIGTGCLFDCSGTIGQTPAQGSNGGAGGASGFFRGGTAGGFGGQGQIAGASAGGAGVTSSDGNAGGGGGQGGDGNNGGTAGGIGGGPTVNSNLGATVCVRTFGSLLTMQTRVGGFPGVAVAPTTTMVQPAGGTGGGGGGGALANNGYGAGGGGGGGVVMVLARVIAIASGTCNFFAKGGDGASTFSGDATHGASTSGGGGGGGGGIVFVGYGTKTGAGSLVASAAGGARGTGYDTVASVAGGVGVAILMAETAVTFSPATGGVIGAGVELNSVNTSTSDFGTLDYGDGSDGALASGAGTTNIRKTMFYSSITLVSGDNLVTNGWAVYCSGTCNIASGAKISNNGGDASTFTGGEGANLIGIAGNVGDPMGAWAAGGRGGGGGRFGAAVRGFQSGTSATTGICVGGNGGKGGDNGANPGGAAGGNTLYSGSTATYATLDSLPFAIFSKLVSASGVTNSVLVGSGGGGGGQGTGGGGGGGGGATILCTKDLVLGGTIEAKGGAGADGTAASNGGGGGGGGGGYVCVVYHTKSGAGTLVATGGAHGLGVGTGANGNDGDVGTTRFIAN